jgi:hypothetical protein
VDAKSCGQATVLTGIHTEAFAMSKITAIFLCTFLLTGCVTAPNGQRKFEPWEAAQRVDESIDVWLEKRSFESKTPRLWNE